MKVLLILSCVLSVVIYAMTVVHADRTGQIPIRSRRNYGESCNKTQRCDKKAWLSCTDDICDCMQPDEMMYVPEKASCVSKSGERCKFQINEGGEDTLAIFEKTDCVENAECGSDGTCACSKNFYENFNGTCSPKAGYNETCSSDAYCQDDKFLSCIEGVCACDSNNRVISPSEGLCKGRAGKQLGNTLSCIDGAFNLNGFCQCDDQYLQYPGSDGYCHSKKGYGEACSVDEECESATTFLKCVEGFCDCDPRNSWYIGTEVKGERNELQIQTDQQSYYDNNGQYKYRYTSRLVRTYTYYPKKQCVGLAGNACNANDFCIENASCYQSKCVCGSGYAPTSKGTCGIGFGEACSDTVDCSDAFICTNGKCDCSEPDHQVQQAGKCVSITHGKCSSDTNCVSNAVCAKSEKSPVSKCQCKDGFVENQQGLCDLEFGSKCSFDSKSVPCDTFAGLKCRNRLCACRDNSTHFDTTSRKCLGLVGSRCKRSSTGIFENQVCVNHAKCVTKYQFSAATCECEDGWIEGEGRVCVPAEVQHVSANMFDSAWDE